MIFGFSVFDLVVIIVSILIAMSVHEAMHAYVGLRLGDTTAAEEGRVSLNPLRHIDPFTSVILPIITLVLLHAPILAAKPVPFNPERVKHGEFGAALIALAGPASNFILALFGALLLRAFVADALIVNALYLFVSLNVALCIFNLVPIPPLDGSRVLFAFAPEPVQRFMSQIEPFGIALIFALVIFTGFGAVLMNLNQYVLQLLV